jgi:hypothetical protein
MYFTRKTLATSMIAAAGATGVALALSTTAAAEPAAPAPPAPSVPGLPFLQQLASNPAAASQLMQGLASVLGGAQATPAAAATPPGATASINLPQPAALPGAAPAAAAAAPQNVLPAGGLGMPNIPFLPLPQGAGFPGGLAALLPSGTPAAAAPAAAAPAAAPAPATTGGGLAPVLLPLSALP